jgi:hypothetical protein
MALFRTSRADAQDRLTLSADLLFYGDNTEFRNPFREGETIFGTTGRLAASVDLNDRTSVTLGVFGNHRFGSDDAFELVRPVATLTVREGGSAFVFGTLPVRRQATTASALSSGPHGLLPPLQRETLAFERPYEAGFQWTLSVPGLAHEAWLAWQRLNTPEHRERFDAGVAASVRLSSAFSVPFQLHVVHEGGQQFAAGPVADSVAAAAGVKVRVATAPMDSVTVELYGLTSRHVPDREEPGRSRNGKAVLGRTSATWGRWETHLLFWRGRDFVKDEGDPNYLSLRRDGRYYGGIRDYAEAGLARTFRPAPDVTVVASARFHRVENHYEYSYRILGVAALRWRMR